MTDKARIKIAAAVTALFLAGISRRGPRRRDDQPQAAATTTRQPTAADAGADRGTATRLGAGRGDAASDERLRRATEARATRSSEDDE